MKIDIPSDTIVDSSGNLTPSWAAFFDRVKDCCQQPRPLSGTTAQRPVRYVELGMMFLDTTLNRTIKVRSINPIVWVKVDDETVVV